jgi:dUTPase
MSSLRLYIVPSNETFADLYKGAAEAYNKTAHSQRNSGFDLYSDATDVDSTYSETAILVSQGCKAFALTGAYGEEPRAFWLAPRSSLSKTKWRLANSLGLIDATYRGTIKAALYSCTNDMKDIEKVHQQRLMQLTTGDLRPWLSVTVLSEMPEDMTTMRGEGGFGSTGI